MVNLKDASILTGKSISYIRKKYQDGTLKGNPKGSPKTMIYKSSLEDLFWEIKEEEKKEVVSIEVFKEFNTELNKKDERIKDLYNQNMFLSEELRKADKKALWEGEKNIETQKNIERYRVIIFFLCLIIIGILGFLALPYVTKIMTFS